MNYWTELSIEYANQKSYLDDLFAVYPLAPEGIREIDTTIWNKVEVAFNQQDNESLIKELLSLDLFPIKDSYIAFLKRDKTAISRNPKTINRICGKLYEMGLDEIWRKCSEPKETNRQIGPLFKRWLDKGSLGIKPIPLNEFLATNDNAILNANDEALKTFAKEKLNYQRNKGLDFVARFNNQYVIGESKFLTDFGGHQNAQFEDAISTIMVNDVDAIKVAILDGVVYLKGNNKMYQSIITTYQEYNIMSALILREFLYQL